MYQSMQWAGSPLVSGFSVIMLHIKKLGMLSFKDNNIFIRNNVVKCKGISVLPSA